MDLDSILVSELELFGVEWADSNGDSDTVFHDKNKSNINKAIQLQVLEVFKY